MKTTRESIRWEKLKKGGDGLVTVVVQDEDDGTVLMVAWMDREAYEKTLETGRMTYHSRSRNALWVKGETSGCFQELRHLYADCDRDTLLAVVHQLGGSACHTGSRSCFYTEIPLTKE